MSILKTEKMGINFGNLWAVRNVSFEIGKKEIVGLIGPNGSGKTTFFNLISGMYKPTEGKVLIKEKETTNLLPNQIKGKGLARTFQSSRLCWELSVLDNVLEGLQSSWKSTWFDSVLRPEKSREELTMGIEKALDLLNYFNPELIDKRFEQVKNIPHIDRRRIEICRGLIAEPDLLLLDEPSAGLNTKETSEMMEHIGHIRKKMKDISIIIIEHDMAVISDVTDRVVVFNAGQEIARGKFSEVSKNPEVKSAYLGGGN